MSEIRAVINASNAAPDLMTRPIRSVPLVLWSAAALRRVLGPSQIAIIAADSEVLALAGSRGLHALGPRGREGTLVIDPAYPFLRADPLRAILASGAASVDRASCSLIERQRANDDESFALIEALVRGLSPDDPHIVGVSAMTLPLAGPIDAIVSDVDGVLTDGGISYADQEEAGRSFNTHDGMGVKRLREAGIKVGWLSATTSGASIVRRATQLGVDVVDAGSGDKGPRFDAICGALGVQPARVLYLGDDVNDLPAIARAGASACPVDARPEVSSRADLILENRGGKGAFREAAEIVLASRAFA